MKFILAIALLVSACAPRTIVGSVNTASGVTSYGPDQYGVVCYQIYTGKAMLSCVKVQ